MRGVVTSLSERRVGITVQLRATVTTGGEVNTEEFDLELDLWHTDLPAKVSIGDTAVVEWEGR